MSIYQYSADSINKQPVSLAQYQGKVLLIVNVASRCGFTPQYTGLQELYEHFAGRNFEILAFPCNQFGGQEPGDELQIKTFCETTYKITFPLFAKVEVNGPNTHPLYEYLKSSCPGILGTEAIKWNFTKFLVDKSGNVVDRFSPNTKPVELVDKIEELLE